MRSISQRLIVDNIVNNDEIAQQGCWRNNHQSRSSGGKTGTMSHEISNVNGIDEAAYALTPAWHGLGRVLAEAPDSAGMIEAAHLDWKVEGHPLYTVIERNGRQERVVMEDHKAVIRMDTGAQLGVVGNGFEFVQNRERFELMDSLCRDGILKYEAAGALRGGRIVWALAKMPTVDTIAAGDDCQRYILSVGGHDGSMREHWIPTSVRVVCMNTVRAALAGNRRFGIKHTRNVKANIQTALKIIAQYDEAFTDFRDKAKLLATRQITRDKAQAYVDSLFPKPAEDASDRAKTIRRNKVESIFKNWRNDRQQLPSIKGTWWALYNSVSEYVDHGANYKGDDRERAENRFMSTLDGDGAELKTEAFELALEMSA